MRPSTVVESGVDTVQFADASSVPALARGLPEVVHALAAVGVPRTFFGFRATSELIAVDAPDGSTVVRFGTSGPFVHICVDPMTGNVVDLLGRLESDPPNANVSTVADLGARMALVNRSMAQFASTVRAMALAFPYFGRDATSEHIAIVVAKLGDSIRQIDPDALEADRHWSTFLDDVEMGSFVGAGEPL